MTVFGMVTTSRSHAYTPHALRSFFRHTPFASTDRFILIDNDATYRGEAHSAITLLQNLQPVGFAGNVNQAMRLAAEHRADLIFLNNDMIFTPGWLEPLLVHHPALVSPMSNWRIQYLLGDFNCLRTLDLEDYLGHEAALEQIVHQHRAHNSGYLREWREFFFCVRIPHAVYSAIGDLDETFGRGGAEDIDYCLRCHLAGISVLVAQQSFVLHFVGKSTWRGGESGDEARQRELHYRQAFVAKWGPLVCALALDGDQKILAQRPDAAVAFEKCDFRNVLEQLRQRPSST